ncbi:M48 family metallopeptidase [Falsiroseomonas selenitidurans]|uniref:M48 family metallopeptidase n=1 Tax=Falsiroseomonas selenitidurans TaxID=2716335 RepID=A0ABX1E7S8_9PROT|nr:SprT family zinc-dependent metalloprotease [Falsiroseomonas selenitidurans]NKC31842.1 M48 family metallopeptidase [Falsiroseomonas selenitidurans]
MDLPDSELITLCGASSAEATCLVLWRPSSRARRVSLRICPRDGAVVVILPPRVGRRAGLALLRDNGAWVLDHLAALAPALPFVDGAELPIGGQPHRIRHDPARYGGAFVEDQRLVVAGQAPFLARRVRDFLHAEARRRILRLVRPHAGSLGVAARAVRVKDTRTRWGSCAPDGTLAFSWRLVMAPGWVLDYVVAHEVAHLREMNHSPRFWENVARLTPHRAAAVEWLRAQGPTLLRAG